MSSRPNFLIVMVEQFSALADPNAGNFPVEMPALRRLAAQSVRFDRAYCNAPVCGPSRMSFLSGLMPHHCGVYDNGSVLPGFVPTFGHLLTRGGYQTAMCGRMHIHGLDQHKGFERRLCSEIMNPSLICGADWPAALEPIRPLPPAPDDVSFEITFRDDPIFRHDEYVTQQARRYLEDVNGAADKRPFCLVAGYFAAHSGSEPNPATETLYQKYLQRDLPLPEFGPGDYEQLPEHARRRHQSAGRDQRIFCAEFHRHRMAAYFARLEFLDQQLAQLLGTLEETGLDAETVVIFTADHGENMGRHGWWGKMNFYEEAERIPLYVRLPDSNAGRIVREAVSLVDITPTLCDLAQCAADVPLDGQTLRPLLEGSRPERDDAPVFSEYHGYCSPGDMYMLLQGRYKYCWYRNEKHELYDRQNDPAEVENLIDDPALQETRLALEAELLRHVDVEAVARAVRDYNCRRRTVSEAMEASAIMQQVEQERADAFRDALDEPWWDGGRYLNAGATAPKF